MTAPLTLDIGRQVRINIPGSRLHDQTGTVTGVLGSLFTVLLDSPPDPAHPTVTFHTGWSGENIGQVEPT